MYTTLFVIIVCALLAVIGVPLGLKLIPQNPVYGVRTRRTLRDEATWFEVNRIGGWALVGAAAVTAILVMIYNGTWLRPWWAQLGVLVVMVAIAVGATLAYERKLPAAPQRD